MDFIVIDTEGRRELREIAIINSSGKLIYEAFNQEHLEFDQRGKSSKSLKNILTDFRAIAENKILVFHNAKHDLGVLERSFHQVGLSFSPKPQTYCTYRQGQKYFPGYSSHALEYLAKKLNLKVDGQYFNREQAHIARYDALFTYQLYLTIQPMNSVSPLINPFSSSRVDHPFQSHPDNTNLYHAQYNTLESVIDDIKYDPNHQSKGAVIIGKPGTGKTHLIMRLAKQRLKLNRLLFVPCPNDANTIKYHTYSCMLDSLNQPIPGTGFNQLEYFLANTFVGIIKSTNSNVQRIQDILDRIQDDPLKLYEMMGGEGTQTRRSNWDYIEKFISDWWFREYGEVGYAPEIIKGIVKYCRYSDRNYKQLIKKWLAAKELEPKELDKIGLRGWRQEMSQEDFSLDAIAVFGKLSLLHEPLIMVFDQLEMLGLDHNRSILLNFGESIKEIFSRVSYSLIILNLFPERWQQFQEIFDGSIIDRISQYQVRLEPPTEAEMREILQLKAKEVNSDLNDLFTPQEIAQIIKDKRSIRAVLNYAAKCFRNRVIHNDDHKPTEETTDQQLTSRLDKLESQQLRLEKLFTNIAQAFNDFVSIPTEISTHSESESNHSDGDGGTPLENEIQNYLSTQQAILEQDYHEAEILLDERDAGKLQDIIQAFQQITPLETDVLPTKRVFPPHRMITNKNLCIGFLSGCKATKFTSRIQNFNEAVATHKQIKFILWRDIRSDDIKHNTVGGKAIAQLNQTKNGEFKVFTRRDRITFELLYKLISDIHNQDLEINRETEFQTVLEIVADHFPDYWLIKELKS